jgi:copper ion binding protein
MIKEYLLKYLEELFVLTNAMAPYLLLGFLFAGILHVFFKKEQVARLLGSKKAKSSFYASLIGVPLPLCSCGVIPTGISIYKSGASKGSTVSFLISTPQTGLDSIFATYSMLGLPYAILRPFIAFVSGIFGGMLTNYMDKETDDAKANTFASDEKPTKTNPIKSMFHYAFIESIQDIAKWLIIGLLIAAFISVILPDNFFLTYVNNDFLGMLIVLAVAVPLYVCATGSIPIAAVLLMKGISPGAALVFLMAGPATNAATITVLGKVMGKKALTGYLVSIIGSALFFGLFIDHFLPREWFTSFMPSNHDHNHGLPFWFELSSSILLVLLLLNIYIKKFVNYFKSKAKSANTLNDVVNNKNYENYTLIKVKGINCNNCKLNLEKSIGAIDGVESVEANVADSTVKIKSQVFDDEKIKKAVEEVGHDYLGIVEKVNHKKNDFLEVSVKGMTCSHCKANVEKAVKLIPGIKNATVDLDKAVVTIEGNNINLEEVKKRIENIGYKYVKPKD